MCGKTKTENIHGGYYCEVWTKLTNNDASTAFGFGAKIGIYSGDITKITEDLKILKPGQQGLGVLIESDAGYVDPNDSRNKPFVNEIKRVTTTCSHSFHQKCLKK